MGLQDQYGKTTSLVEVITASKDSILNSVNVGTLARIEEIKSPFDYLLGYGVAVVTPFPLDSATAYKLEVYFITNMTYAKNQLVAVLFMDNDFRGNLKYGKDPIKAATTSKHAKMHGVIVAPTYPHEFVNFKED